MPFYRRRLPHLDQIQQAVFVTWRLYGSLPPNRTFPVATVRSGKAFAALDRLLDQTLSGPFHLRQPELADMVVEAIHYNAFVLGHYELHAFVVMPNHVHVLVTPTLALWKLTKSLKGITAKRANARMALTGSPFWQEESYDHLVRNQREFEKIRSYVATSRRIPFAPAWWAMPASTVGQARDGRPGGRPRTRGSAPGSAPQC